MDVLIIFFINRRVILVSHVPYFGERLQKKEKEKSVQFNTLSLLSENFWREREIESCLVVRLCT